MTTMTKDKRLAWGVQAFATLLLVWIVLDGVQSLAVGLLASAVGAFVGARFAPVEPYGWRPLHLLAFCAFFVAESFRGALDVAWRALHPALPIEPHLERYPISLPAGKPRTLLVSMVSLLPGTLSADLSARDNVLVVHASVAEPRAAVAALERRIARLFGLTLEPRT
jgi:multicomponent Na+:H+ antiporter subunit E